ncbi:hypothetical protein [Salirhabdus salicampi]|uniref:hypothetical protein n=1 Tax=Salirhabdus salicampi TaxID=476102 RepID=UPI0020C38AE4|nr:hypothetical protein [Salirhabdus salicampi]MCP8615860.1 hypothetical protein [Salirhabdus salicampi]
MDNSVIILVTVIVSSLLSFVWVAQIRGLQKPKVLQDEHGQKYFQIGWIGPVLTSVIFSIIVLIAFIEFALHFGHVFLISLFGTMIGLALTK